MIRMAEERRVADRHAALERRRGGQLQSEVRALRTVQSLLGGTVVILGAGLAACLVVIRHARRNS